MEQSLVSRIKYLLGSHWNSDIYIYVYSKLRNTIEMLYIHSMFLLFS